MEMPEYDPHNQRWGGVDWDTHVLEHVSREAKRAAYATRDLLALLDEGLADPEVLKLYGESCELAYSVHLLASKLAKPSLWASVMGDDWRKQAALEQTLGTAQASVRDGGDPLR